MNEKVHESIYEIHLRQTNNDRLRIAVNPELVVSVIFGWIHFYPLHLIANSNKLVQEAMILH